MKVRSILVVEDSDEDQFLNQAIIAEFDASIAVHQAYNGQEALDMIGNGLAVDLIMLDINMPLMDGFEFLDKYDPLFQECGGSVVVMLTSSRQTGDMQKARSYGCVKDYILKPLTVDTLRRLAQGVSPLHSAF